MYSSPPIGVLWLIVLTVPAGQVAEETVIEEEAEEAEKLPLTKKPRLEEMTDSVEESKVIFLAVVERRQKTRKPDFSRPEPLSFCLLLGILTCVAYFYRKALKESYFSSASRRLIEEPRSTDTSS